MTINGWIQIAIYCAIVVALVKPLGWYMTAVFNGERTFLSPVLRPVEAGLYRLGGVDEKREQDWLTYTVAMLFFHVGGFLILYGLLRLQGFLPFNPQGMTAVPEYLSFNTAISFITNTNWQNYGGESTLSYLVQMLGLTHQNFLSAATGIVLAVALIRGFARASTKTDRQFLGRYHPLHALHPHSDLHSLCSVSDLAGHAADARRLCRRNDAGRRQADHRRRSRRLADRHQDARHQWRRLLQRQRRASLREPDRAVESAADRLDLRASAPRSPMCSAAWSATSARAGPSSPRWASCSSRAFLSAYWAEAAGNPQFASLGLDPANMEGKEVRFGVALSALFAVITTAASCGAVNAMHDSFTAARRHDSADQH